MPAFVSEHGQLEVTINGRRLDRARREMGCGFMALWLPLEVPFMLHGEINRAHQMLAANIASRV
jgi:hypothetical protein